MSQTPRIGKLQKIRIEHDNKGMAPGWFLERVRRSGIMRNHGLAFLSLCICVFAFVHVCVCVCVYYISLSEKLYMFLAVAHLFAHGPPHIVYVWIILVEQVVLTHRKTGRAYFFNCNQWLAKVW